jgi:CubicO group peptidase (beta-lactamase class C family)
VVLPPTRGRLAVPDGELRGHRDDGSDALGSVAGWPVDHAAVGILRLGRPDGGSGPLVTESAGVTGPVDRLFPWASVTKPVTALATLVAVEEGSLSLDEPAGPRGSTVRHLLAHASGLGPEAGPPLAPPGTRRIYSNAGYAVVADLIAERSGLAFSEYLSEGVLGPLQMAGTVLRESPGGAAAAGLVGPLEDLLALAREWSTPTLVSAETHRAATTIQFPGLAGVLPGFQRFDPCDWGLGVEIRGHKQPHWTGTTNAPDTFGHFGQSGAFLWFDPVIGVACAGLSDRREADHRSPR